MCNFHPFLCHKTCVTLRRLSHACWHVYKRAAHVSVDSVCNIQAKGVAKKFQQSTPKGAPTKPQPLQKAGPLEAAKVQCMHYMLHNSKPVAITDSETLMMHLLMIAANLMWCNIDDSVETLSA